MKTEITVSSTAALAAHTLLQLAITLYENDLPATVQEAKKFVDALGEADRIVIVQPGE